MARATGGRTYSILDPVVDPAARYFIEDLDRKGVKTWYGPIPVSTDPAVLSAVRSAEAGASLRTLSRARRPSRKAGPLGIAPAASADAMQLGTFAANATRATSRERATQKVLAGRPAVALPDRGPVICVCFDVGLTTIIDAIAAQTLTSVEAVGKAINAGTNCGSCRPAIARLLATGKESLHA